MNKRNKIIVSIVGITIVLLALLGITYAYYLTRIEGNTNTNSISITTADLKLVYRENDGIVTAENIMPGTTIEKNFTVTNDGNNKVDNYAVYLEEVINTLSRTEDLTYVLECTSSSGTCEGSKGKFPTLAEDIVVNSIDTEVTHTYKLTVTYKNEENIDQSIDMGSKISALVQIYAMKDILDIEGEVTGASEGDFAQINSVQKRSQIVDGKYKFAGVLPGTHTIKICGKTDTNCTSPKLTKEIVVNLGTEAKVDGNTITITDDSQTATINMTINGSETTTTINPSIKDYDPNEGILVVNYTNGKNIDITTNKIVEDVDIAAEAYAYPFNITNVDKNHRNITIKLTDIEMDEALKDIDFRWGLYNADTGNGLSFGIFKDVENNEIMIYTDTIIDAAEPDITNNYILRIWVHNNGTAQTHLLNKNFSAKIQIDGEIIEYTPESCFTFDAINNAILDYDVNKCGTNIVIPKTINNINVTRIGYILQYLDDHGIEDYTGPFYNKGIKSVIISDSIFEIGYDAFGKNLLTNITLPSNVSYSDSGSFSNNQIENIYLSDYTSFYDPTFINNKLKTLVLPGTTGFDGGEIFVNNNLSNVILMDGITYIPYSTFKDNQLISVELPSSMDEVQRSVFSNNSLTEIIIRGKESLEDFEYGTEGIDELSNVNIVFRP